MSSPALWNIMSTLSPAMLPEIKLNESMGMQRSAMMMLVLMMMTGLRDVVKKKTSKQITDV
jgi:hypothetical protein